MAIPRHHIKVEVDWDRDGNYNHGLSDISDKVRVARWRYGSLQDSLIEGMPESLFMSITVDDRNGNFTPINRRGALFGKLFNNTPIKVSMNDNYRDVVMATGYIHEVIPQRNNTDQFAEFICFGPLGYLALPDFDVSARLSEDPSLGEVATNAQNALERLNQIVNIFTTDGAREIADLVGLFNTPGDNSGRSASAKLFRTDEVLKLLFDTVNWPQSLRDFDQGKTRMSKLQYDKTGFLGNRKQYVKRVDAARGIGYLESGWLGENRTGGVVFRNRETLAKRRLKSPQCTFTDNNARHLGGRDFTETEVKQSNNAIVMYHRIETSDLLENVYNDFYTAGRGIEINSAQEIFQVPTKNAFKVLARSQQKFTYRVGQYEGTGTGANVDEVAVWYLPEAGKQFTVWTERPLQDRLITADNFEYQGSNVTHNGHVTIEVKTGDSSNKYCTFTISNTSDQDLWIVDFACRGNPVELNDTYTVSRANVESQRKYGRKPLALPSSIMVEQASGIDYVDWLSKFYENPRPKFDVRYTVARNNDPENYWAIQTKLGDVVNLTADTNRTNFNITKLKCVVTREEHTVDRKGHHVDFGMVSLDDETPWWIIGDSALNDAPLILGR